MTVRSTEGRTVRVHVDHDLCQGHGQCELTAPAVFELDDDGVVHVVEAPPDDEEPAVRQAERLCPQQAIRVTGATGERLEQAARRP